LDQPINEEVVTVNRITPDILNCTSDGPYSNPNLEEYKNNSVTDKRMEIADNRIDESVVRNESRVAYPIHSPSCRAVD
jgi:hypothetical protein